MEPNKREGENDLLPNDLSDDISMDTEAGLHTNSSSPPAARFGPFRLATPPFDINSLDLEPAEPQKPRSRKTTPTSGQAAEITANIPVATSIDINNSSQGHASGHAFDFLFTRQTALDPFVSLAPLKRRLYGCPSMVQRLCLERRLKEHRGCVNCINFSWGGRLLASGSDDLHVVLWDWARGNVVGKFDSGHVANVFQTKFMPHCEDSVLVTAARDGQVICDVITTTGELHHSKRVGHHNDSAHKLSIEPDSPHVFLSCGEDGSVLQIDLREDNTRNKILVCKNEKNRRISLYSIFIDPSDPYYFAVSGRDQWARIYDRRLLREEPGTRHEPVKRYCPHHLMNPESEMKRANITCLVYSHDGKELLCSYNDEDVYLFNARHSSEAEYVHKYVGHRNSATVKGVNFFGLESEYVTSGSDCGNVFLWDKHTERVVQYMDGDHEGVVNCLEAHPHIPILATSGLDHDVKIFSPTASRPTNLDGLQQVIEKNQTSRQEAWDSAPSDGYEVIMEFIMRQYRRGLRERAGIHEDESDDSVESLPDNALNEGGDEEGEEEGEGEDRGERRLRRCIQQ